MSAAESRDRSRSAEARALALERKALRAVKYAPAVLPAAGDVVSRRLRAVLRG